MEYSIKLADQFLDEFEEICDYISNKLKNIEKIVNQLKQLATEMTIVNYKEKIV